MSDHLGYPEFDKRRIAFVLGFCALFAGLPIALDRTGLVDLPDYLVYLPLVIIAVPLVAFVAFVAGLLYFRK